MAAAAAAVVVVAYTLADRTQVALADKTAADMTAAVVVALLLDLYFDPCLDPVGPFSKRSWDGSFIQGYMCSSRDCWISGNSPLLEPAP